MSLKVAVVGAGHMGKIHLQKLLSMEDVQVVGVIDRDISLTEDISEKYRIPFFSDYLRMTGEIDCVIVASSTETHFEIAKLFLENKIHVFVEKPITSDVAEAASLIELAEKENLVLQVGHLERFNPAFKKAAPLIQNPVFVKACRTSNFTGRSSNIDVVLDLMIHDIDLVLSIAKSDVKNITSQGISFIGDTLDMVNTTIEFMNGFTAGLFASRIASQKERSLSVFEKDKNIYIDLLNGKSIFNIKKGDNNIETSEYVSDKIDSVMEELLEFVSSIKGEKKPSVRGEDGLKALILANQIKENIA